MYSAQSPSGTKSPEEPSVHILGVPLYTVTPPDGIVGAGVGSGDGEGAGDGVGEGVGNNDGTGVGGATLFELWHPVSNAIAVMVKNSATDPKNVHYYLNY